MKRGLNGWRKNRFLANSHQAKQVKSNQGNPYHNGNWPTQRKDPGQKIIIIETAFLEESEIFLIVLQHVPRVLNIL